jgi:5'-3' exonuclease
MTAHTQTPAVIDISAVYWRCWHASAEDDVSSAKRKTLSIIDSIAQKHTPVIVAIDSPPYLRREVYPAYKQQREERSAASIEELRQAIVACENAGYVIASSAGYEADDVIATIAHRDPSTVIYGSDKDLLQISDSGIIDPFDGHHKTAMDKFGVVCRQVPDILSLIGDASDNIPGIKGVGPKTALALLNTFGTLDGIMSAIIETPDKFKPATLAAFKASWDFLPTALQLVTLSTNVDLTMKKGEVMKTDEPIDAEFEEVEAVPVPVATQPDTQSAIVTAPILEAITYRQSLEPIGVEQAWKVAQKLFQSRLYSHFATPGAIYATIMRGRALGIDATTALDSIHLINGKPTMSAALIVGLVLDSGKAHFFDCIEQSATACTWVTKRRGSPNEIRRTFTIDEARNMKLTGKDNWNKQPHVMLQWRAASALARMVYPDVIAGLYAREEMED